MRNSSAIAIEGISLLSLLILTMPVFLTVPISEDYLKFKPFSEVDSVTSLDDCCALLIGYSVPVNKLLGFGITVCLVLLSRLPSKGAKLFTLSLVILAVGLFGPLIREFT